MWTGDLNLLQSVHRDFTFQTPPQKKSKLNWASLLKFATGHEITQENEGWLMVQSELHAGSISICFHISIIYYIMVALRVQNNNTSEKKTYFAHQWINKYAENQQIKTKTPRLFTSCAIKTDIHYNDST